MINAERNGCAKVCDAKSQSGLAYLATKMFATDHCLMETRENTLFTPTVLSTTSPAS